MQYKGRKAGKSTASWSRECSTKAGMPAVALQAGAGSAVQRPESRQEHCKLEPGVQCRSRHAGSSTASWSRECSAKARKQVITMQARAESAVQKPTSRHQHCHYLAGMQCTSRKVGCSNASWIWECSAKASKPSVALQAGAGSAVQKPKSRQ